MLFRSITQTNSITKHYQKSFRSWQRKAKDQQKKLEREDSIFNQSKSSYMFWKNNSPWQSQKDERDAIDKVFQNIQMHKDMVQMKRISSYHSEALKKIEDELKKRLEVLNKS